MKILMTGMTARAVGSTKVKYDYISLPAMYRDALRELGHEVDMRTTRHEEDLDEYDRALVLVNWVSSLSSGHSHETGLALAKLGDRAILYVDDRAASIITKDIDVAVLNDAAWEKHTRGFRGREYATMTSEQVDLTREALSRIALPNCPWPMLTAMYDWGDHSKFFGASRVAPGFELITVDPTAILPPAEVWDRERQRAWVIAMFQNPQKWLTEVAPTWPVTQYGGDPKPRGGGAHGTDHPVIPEAELIQAYADHRGMLVPPSKTDGSGWWRVRYAYALLAGAIVFPPPLDGEAIGPSFTNSLEDIEAASDDELEALAQRQREQMAAWTWPKDKFMFELEKAVQ
jgi:hypothetical protein